MNQGESKSKYPNNYNKQREVVWYTCSNALHYIHRCVFVEKILNYIHEFHVLELRIEMNVYDPRSFQYYKQKEVWFEKFWPEWELEP